MTFKRLGPDIHVRYATGKAKSVLDPDIIVIFGWMDAKFPHVLKYAQGYETLYPGANQLIIQAPRSLFWTRNSIRVAGMAPAVKALKDLGIGGGSSWPRMIIHTFSNGGCFQLSTLLQAFSQSLPPGSQVLPARAIIFDSCPGTSSLSTFIRGFTVGLSTPLRLVFSIFLAIIYTSLTFFLRLYNLILRRKGSPYTAMQSTLLDPTLLPLHTPRLFLYSMRDRLVPPHGVEAFAQRCRDGGVVVKMEKYEKSEHVNHMKHDPERYWGAVKNIWETGMERRG